MTSVLVAFSTRSGSTAEVAQAIGAALRQAGHAAEVLPVSEVKSLAGRTAVALGAPLYAGRFPKEFHQFLARHEQALRGLPTWCFVLGPVRDLPADFESARKQAWKQLARYSWLSEAEVRVFGGRWSAAGLPFPFSLFSRLLGRCMNKVPSADIRNWDEIRAWARMIGEARELAQPVERAQSR